MYLGYLKSLLASGQVSQYIPHKTGNNTGSRDRALPSAPLAFRLGRGKIYLHSSYNIVADAYYHQENHKFDCVDLTLTTMSSSLWTSYNQKAYFSNSGTAGYHAGGTNNSGTAVNVMQKIIYSSDSVSTLSATMSGTGRIMPCANNNQTAGYMIGSALGSLSTAIDKLAYSNDTRSTLGATTSQARYGDTGFSNSGTAGYRCFGEG